MLLIAPSHVRRRTVTARSERPYGSQRRNRLDEFLEDGRSLHDGWEERHARAQETDLFFNRAV